MKTEPGTKVLISQDCRDGSPATGQIGVYEGDFPLSIVLVDEGSGEQQFKEIGYSYYVNDVSLKRAFPVWEGGEHGSRYAMVMNNPRIKLDDGSVIWGAECWWGEVVDGLTLEDAQKQTEKTKLILRTLTRTALDPLSADGNGGELQAVDTNQNSSEPAPAGK